MTTLIENLRRRSRLVQDMRAYFHRAGYTEVQAPCLIDIPSIEPHIDPLAVVNTQGAKRYLHTSPEYALKKLLGAGMGDCFSLGPCFRDEPNSPHHSPEFTMLEWYATHRNLVDLMDQTETFIKTIWNNAGRPRIEREGYNIDMEAPFSRATVSELFQQYMGLCPIELNTYEALAHAADSKKLRYSKTNTDFDSLFHQLFLNYIEPNIGRSRPAFVWGWPPSQAALACLSLETSPVALRFELYAGGLELANAFEELTDSDEQRRRFEGEQQERTELGKTVFPLDDDLLSALPLMPPTSGIALGVDRLIMLLLNVNCIEEVIA
ncbi:MAG: EF-P lysine aminoacylase EpmA [Bradymonadia bacterium]